jgi:hypothetical protein
MKQTAVMGYPTLACATLRKMWRNPASTAVCECRVAQLEASCKNETAVIGSRNAGSYPWTAFAG